MADFDALKAKVKKFTDVESVLMKAWLEGVLRGRLAEAAEVLDSGLLLEHWQSVLDPEAPSAEERAEEARLQAEFDHALARLRGVPEAPEGERDGRDGPGGNAASDYAME